MQDRYFHNGDRFNSVLFINFIKIFTALLIIFCTISIMFYVKLTKVANEEFTTMSNDYVSRVANSFDTIFEELKYFTCNLSIDSDVSLYSVQNDYNMKIGNTDAKLIEKLKSYKMSIKYIDSIYIYSEDYKRVCDTQSIMPYEDFPDKSWFSYYSGSEKNKLTVFVRDVSAGYPKVITFLYHENIFDYDSAIIVNVNVSKLGKSITDKESNGRINTCITDKNDNIVYIQKKVKDNDDIYGNISDIVKNNTGIFRKNGEMYIGGCRESESLDFKYVCITRLNSYSDKIHQVINSVILFMILALLIGAGLSFYLAKSTYKPIETILGIVGQKNSIDYHNIKENEIREITTKILLMVNDNEKLKSELTNSLQMYDNLQMNVLQSQIRPHFLNNTLNMISAESTKELGCGNELSRLISKLGKMLKYSYAHNEYIVRLEDEIEFLKQYIYIMYKRYKNFEMVWNIEDDTRNSKFIRLGLQPIVENAIYHGIAQKTDGNGIIEINTYNNGTSTYISVKDNGVGMDEEKLSSIRELLKESNGKDSHIGIKNVYNRIKLIFGADADMIIKSTLGKETEYIVKIPQK